MRLSLLTCASLHSEYGGCGQLTHTRCSLQTDPQATRSLAHDRLHCISPPPALFQLAKRLHLSSCPDWMHCLCKSWLFVARLVLLPLETKASAMDKSYEERSSLKKQHATKEALRLCAMISLPKREISFALRFLECVTAD